MYKARGFAVDFLLTDDEFSGLAVALLKEGILLDETTTNDHIPEIERLIRTIKEIHRGRVNTLPSNIIRLPKLLKSYSVLQSVMWINISPRKGGGSNTISRRGLIKGR